MRRKRHAHLILEVSAPTGFIVTTAGRIDVTFLMRLRCGIVARDGTRCVVSDVGVVHDCTFGVLTWLSTLVFIPLTRPAVPELARTTIEHTKRSSSVKLNVSGGR